MKQNEEKIYKILNAWLRNSTSIFSFMKKEIKDKKGERPEGNAWRAIEKFLIVFL